MRTSAAPRGTRRPGAEPGEVLLGVRPVGGLVVGIERHERVGDGPDHRDHARRIEPHVGVDAAGERLAVHLALGARELRIDGQHRDGLEQIQPDGALRGAAHGGLDLRLEAAAQIHGDVGSCHRLHLAGGELHVVGALARPGERRDRHPVPAHAPRRLFERVEGDHDSQPSVSCRRVTVTVRARRCQHCRSQTHHTEGSNPRHAPRPSCDHIASK
jgi:hypothetical protein